MFRSVPIFIGLRYFSSGGRANRLISFISMLALIGLSLGVGMLILVLSVMNGFDKEMREHILSVVPHVQLVNPMSKEDWRSQRQLIATVPQVSEVSPFNQLEGMVFSRNNTRPIQVLGFSPDAIPKGLSEVLKRANVGMPKKGELLLAKPIAEALNLSLGKPITLILPSEGKQRAQIAPLRLTGVFSTRTELDQVLGIVSLSQAGQLLGDKDSIYGFRVQVDDLFNAKFIGQRILSQLPKGFQLRDWTQTHGNLYHAIQLSRNMVGLLVFLIIGVAAFNVISMLMMMVINKRKDIAILQTMGLSKQHIVQLFLVQGVLIACLGIFLGVVLGVMGCYWVADFVQIVEGILGAQFLNTSVYPIDYVPVDLRWRDVFFVALSAIGLTLLAALYPAIKASRTVPAEALKYEN